MSESIITVDVLWKGKFLMMMVSFSLAKLFHHCYFIKTLPSFASHYHHVQNYDHGLSHLQVQENIISRRPIHQFFQKFNLRSRPSDVFYLVWESHGQKIKNEDNDGDGGEDEDEDDDVDGDE